MPSASHKRQPSRLYPVALSVRGCATVLGGGASLYRRLRAAVADGSLPARRIGVRQIVLIPDLIEFLRDNFPLVVPTNKTE